MNAFVKTTMLGLTGLIMCGCAATRGMPEMAEPSAAAVWNAQYAAHGATPPMAAADAQRVRDGFLESSGKLLVPTQPKDER